MLLTGKQCLVSHSSSLSPVSNHSPSASAAAVAAAAAGTAAAAGQAVSGWVEFLRGLLGDPNGSSQSSWEPAVLTGEETCKGKGSIHGGKKIYHKLLASLFQTHLLPSMRHTAQIAACNLCCFSAEM